jgi:rubrerythrin
MQAQTRANLLTAMHGEAFAFAQYMVFAKQARAQGREEVAALFEATAQVEAFEHFAEEAALAGVGGDGTANLRQAIEGETYEVETMYRQFAEQAEAAGDRDAAARFREILGDERGHRDAFAAALATLTAPDGP